MTSSPHLLNTTAPLVRGADSSIGGLLLESGKITPENAERVLRMQKELGIRFGEAALRLGLITEADIEQVLARQFDYPYLQPGAGKYPQELVAAYQPFSHQVETLRAVRSQLMLRWFARGSKSLVVLGMEPGDGASLFAANLAVVFSQLGEHTLLVDANLRAPRQQEIFDLKTRQGLSDVLAGRAELDIIAKVESFVALSVLAAGTLPPNPQELLSRTSFVTLNKQLESRYDVVLYDVPAYATGSDALAVAARAGGVLLVARKNKTPMAEVAAMAEQMTHSGAQVVGSVMVDF
ncbi:MULTISPECIES: chain length determinant protein tyrosine kinase EpsG [Janthinobacterium]|jgi:protein-tyrosine kinase|uniref:Chain length determinant protein tyrosine kinase EpsG n=1 Tax=Janthinobacterium rivuli TaxID=2751478 RepID=A0ABY8I9R0_9BURK|nr:MULTISPECIES: chain length determinant protein tyrosine kinase EpsG [Janthinobacterium]PHV34976.1 chain length determinant protein tyrosine kinase EpsG [Janthinobacterium sp. BJB312]MBW3512480.1 chain length determinant protein tyrosine kinase EpsG [Janthinobacterium sp. NKUCC06_STL]MCA1862792.1 chain length determinant protein tyrosine kinase EpsG [Janthinobacterium lividum]MDZ5634591.1 chain length determinant protein tyrosine kinase EpsG [Janthinobacterium sp. GMG1]NVI82061.1 chain lengt